MESFKTITMAQYTALEWFYEETIIKGKTNYYDLFEQAKVMEKQQIIKAVYDGMGTNFDPNFGRAEQYYKQTYENNQ